ncbi:type I restriction endonuclease subunit R [Domibacillus sp. PGB-M46]|uniref:type I restriction endonuclease subunit R n=1 Tax=Domibacillus sp. PGB-M46 TaxID=2910255 RepID=UPI001F5AAF32|nr:type I restriction endonuclease subunit R [Domibacillus sp. PGB-M46]MCI2255532.1 type I restriction endonuclease subunit R [Domibacillus sp. PGB-M46]
MANGLYESDFEDTTIERLKRIGYSYLHATELFRGRESVRDVVLRDRLEFFLRREYPSLPDKQIPILASLIINPDGVTNQQRNERFHEMLTKGFTFSWEDGVERYFEHIFPINWKEYDENDFLVVNQLSIEGRFSRRPDIIVFINGLPLIIFELKSPYNEQATVDDAYTQITNYTNDIPQLFIYNAFSVISDNVETLHGVPGAPIEFFSAWKSTDGRTVDNNVANTMKTLIEGLFPKKRLLEYIRFFLVYMRDGEKAYKIGAKYHQFFGVKFAVQETIRATRPEGNRKIGVIWHTQGSGKSISMMFFAGMIVNHPDMENPSVVIQVDRSDLDQQLYDTFKDGENLVGNIHHAESADELREILKNESGQIVFSTIEKFRLKKEGSEGEEKKKEIKHPVLSTRRNIIVISDEAHRTQYNEGGFAGHLRTALPNASHIAFTGTPIDFVGRNTVELFGNYIHVYDMQQAVLDKATVPIYYESRLIPLDNTNAQLNEDFQELISQADSNDESSKAQIKWSALKSVVGTQPRLARLAKDILYHFEQAASPQDKAMIVCMSREICVALYEEMKKLPNCPLVEIIMTGNVKKDPEEWKTVTQPGSEYPHIKTKEEQRTIKENLKDEDHPLKMVIVTDMWLTGTDIPTMKFLYVDKPMRGHNLMQAIARVNRVFPGKEGGVIVDFIGIAQNLKEATKKYTNGGGKGKPTFDIEAAVAIFYEHLGTIRNYIPQGTDVSGWKAFEKVDREDYIAELVGKLLGDDQEAFLTAQLKLKQAHQLVRHIDEVRSFANEITLYQLLATQIRKIVEGNTGKRKKEKDLEQQVAKLVNESIEAKEAIDLFAVAGIEKPDISILDEAFMADLVEKKHVDLRLKLLKKLLDDELKLKLKSSNPKQKTLKEALEKAITEYHDRVISAADVIRMMMEVRKGMEDELRFEDDLGLSDEEVAFYHVIENLGDKVFTNEFIASLVRKVLTAMKKEFKVDWTNPHRVDVLSKVNLAVKMVLMKEKITGEQLKFLTNAIVEQAKEQYKDWPRNLA